MTVSRSRLAFITTMAAAVTIGLGAPAAASGTWTVSPGGAASIRSESGLTLDDETTGVIIECESSSLAGMFQAGSGLPGAKIASITSVRFTTCGLGKPDGSYTLSARGLPWFLNATYYNTAKDTVVGTISGIHVVISAVGCHTVVDGTGARAFDGTEKFRYNNARHLLSLNFPVTGASSTLHFYNTSGCFGFFKNGASATFAAFLKVRPGQVITSP